MNEKHKNLPCNWELVSLADLAINPKNDIVDGPFGSNLKASEYVNSGVPIVRLQNIKRNYFLNKNISFVTKEKYEQLARHTYIRGDILITKLGAPLGVACKAPEYLNSGVIVADIVRCRFPEKYVNIDYITYAINSPLIIEQFKNNTKGSTRPRVNLNFVRDLKVPFAPLLQQKLVVDKIEELFSYIDAGVEGLKQAKVKLQQYRQSVLKDAVTGKLTETWREQNSDKLEPANELLERILEERRANWEAEQLKSFEEKSKIPKDDKWKEKYVEPKGAVEVEDLPNSWVSTITDQVFSFVTSGSRGWAKYYSEEGPLFLRVGNLFHYNVELDFRKLQRVSPPEGSEGSRTKVEEGDNLISITADVGMVGYVPSNFEEAYINQHVALARPVQRVMGKYLSWLLSGDFAKEQFKTLQKGATKAGLGLDDIRSISFGLPSLLEQKQIVQEIESKITGIDRLKKETELKILHASKLKSSILADAFSGKLVENIETYETAEQLLEKIKAEKEKLLTDKPNAAIKRKKKVTSERKSLLTVLSDQKEEITADVLMQEAGFKSVDIDDFYVELASIAEKVEQIAPTQDTLKNWPYDKAANIKLKLKD
jgi:type I restriction enzyme S subunit